LFRPWMFAIVKHKTIDSLRHQRSQQRAIDTHRAGARNSDQFTASDTLEEQLSEGRLINSLSPQHREAVTLTKIIGLSTAEAATRLNISESALKVRVHRAIGKLKRLLEADEL
jgi:RNA polymerase sigma-70 factor (ECF subfamily)